MNDIYKTDDKRNVDFNSSQKRLSTGVTEDKYVNQYIQGWKRKASDLIDSRLNTEQQELFKSRNTDDDQRRSSI